MSSVSVVYFSDCANKSIVDGKTYSRYLSPYNMTIFSVSVFLLTALNKPSIGDNPLPTDTKRYLLCQGLSTSLPYAQSTVMVSHTCTFSVRCFDIPHGCAYFTINQNTPSFSAISCVVAILYALLISFPFSSTTHAADIITNCHS